MRCSVFVISLSFLFGINYVLINSEEILMTLNYQDENGETRVKFNEIMLKQFLICLCDETIPECQASAHISDGNNYLVHFASESIHDKNVTAHRKNIKCDAFPSDLHLFTINCSSTVDDCKNERNHVRLKATWKTRSRLGNNCLGTSGINIAWSERLNIGYYNTSKFNITSKCRRKDNRSHSTNQDNKHSSTNVDISRDIISIQQSSINLSTFMEIPAPKTTDFGADDPSSLSKVHIISTSRYGDNTSTILIAILTPSCIGVIILLVIVSVRRKRRALRSARRYSLPRLTSVEDSKVTDA